MSLLDKVFCDGMQVAHNVDEFLADIKNDTPPHMGQSVMLRDVDINGSPTLMQVSMPFVCACLQSCQPACPPVLTQHSHVAVTKEPFVSIRQQSSGRLE